MPMRKKSAATRATGAGISHKEEEDTQQGQEVSLLSAAAEKHEPVRKKSGKKKKGKKKSSKLSAAERKLVKLEKGYEALKGDSLAFTHFVSSMDSWLLNYGKRCSEFFRVLDTENSGVVAYDEFSAGLFDMSCPCNSTEMHVLCKILDFENCGEIAYAELGKGLRWFLKLGLERNATEYDYDKDNSHISLVRGQSARDIKHCACCKVGLWTQNQPSYSYINLTLFLITFVDTVRNHPCHLTRVVHSHITIYGLIQLIKSEAGIQSNTLSIFRDKSRSSGSELAHHLTLDDIGFDGRDWHNPIDHVLFYDFACEYSDCPLLMADHYFINRKLRSLAF